MIRKFSGDTIGLQTFLLHCFGKSLSIQPSTVSASVKFSSWPQCRMHLQEGFNGSSASNESTCNAGDPGSIPGSGRSTGEGRSYLLQCSSSLVAQLAKNLPAMRETWVQSLCWKDPLEEGKATHSSILAWRIPWTV